ELLILVLFIDTAVPTELYTLSLHDALPIYPGVTVDVVIDQSSNLRKRLDERRLDVTLINISHTVPNKGDVEVLLDEELVWAGAKCGTAYRRDPLPLSIWEEGCAWRGNALEGLESSGRPYRI